MQVVAFSGDTCHCMGAHPRSHRRGPPVPMRARTKDIGNGVADSLARTRPSRSRPAPRVRARRPRRPTLLPHHVLRRPAAVLHDARRRERPVAVHLEHRRASRPDASEADRALFTYSTEDKVAAGAGRTGGLTLLRVATADGDRVLAAVRAARARATRTPSAHLYKDPLGTTLVFEETRPDLGLRVRVDVADRRPVRRRARGRGRRRRRTGGVEVEVLDGFVDLLPAGVTVQTQDELSSLLDAYKRAEVDAATGLGLVYLNSDAHRQGRARASRSRRPSRGRSASTTSTTCCPRARSVRSRRASPVVAEHEVRGEKGAYLVRARLALAPGEHAPLERRRRRRPERRRRRRACRRSSPTRRAAAAALAADVEGTRTAPRPARRDRRRRAGHGRRARGRPPPRQRAVQRHARRRASSTGTPSAGGRRARVRRPAQPADRWPARGAWFDAPAATEQLDDLVAAGGRVRRPGPAAARARVPAADVQPPARRPEPALEQVRDRADATPTARRAWTSRATGGTSSRTGRRWPGRSRSTSSRWSRSSSTRRRPTATTRTGSRAPASTGRCPSPSNPWANIGYWSDHQVDLPGASCSRRRAGSTPAGCEALVDRAVFTHADVPYRIATYDADRRRPDRHDRVRRRGAGAGRAPRSPPRARTGGCVHGPTASSCACTLAEKLLLILLAKLVNLVPDGGIWMNTQRPEWNDANNALVGKGLSVVTLAYLRRALTLVRGPAGRRPRR